MRVAGWEAGAAVSVTASGPVRERFSSRDALALAREIRSLDHPRIDKAFDLPGGGWALSLKLREGGRRDLRLVPGRYGAVVPAPPEHPESPGPFARDLRRLLGGALLTGVANPGGERLLDAELARADGQAPMRIVVEFFGTGNFLVVRDGTLVAVAHPKTWAHRTVRVGEPFVPAPAVPDPWEASSAQLEVLLLGSSADRVSTLAARAGFGGSVAEELLVRTGVDGRASAREDAGSVAVAVRTAAQRLLEEIGERP